MMMMIMIMVIDNDDDHDVDDDDYRRGFVGHTPNRLLRQRFLREISFLRGHLFICFDCINLPFGFIFFARSACQCSMGRLYRREERVSRRLHLLFILFEAEAAESASLPFLQNVRHGYGSPLPIRKPFNNSQ